jgi:hypothetical protein
MKKLLKRLVDWLDGRDRWLCVYLKPLRLRLWWCRLWLRKDEFHPSLNHDATIAHHLKEKGGWEALRNYQMDVTRRRSIMHERTL